MRVCFPVRSALYTRQTLNIWAQTLSSVLTYVIDTHVPDQGRNRYGPYVQTPILGVKYVLWKINSDPKDFFITLPSTITNRAVNIYRVIRIHVDHKKIQSPATARPQFGEQWRIYIHTQTCQVTIQVRCFKTKDVMYLHQKYII